MLRVKHKVQFEYGGFPSCAAYEIKAEQESDMVRVVEKQLDSLMAAADEAAPIGLGGGEQDSIMKLLAIMSQASKQHYIVRTIPACNSDD